MSIQGMSEAWSSYRNAVDHFYSVAGERLRNGESLDPDGFLTIGQTLDSATEWSGAIRREAEELLAFATGSLYDDISRLVLVAAAVDAMLANDIVAVDPDPEIAELRSPDPLDEGATYQTTDDERHQMLQEADAEFLDMPEPQMAGAREPPNKQAVIREVHGSVDELMKLAGDPGRQMVRGIVSVAFGAIGTFVAEVVAADVTTHLATAAGSLPSRAPKFIDEYVLKLRSLREMVPDVIEEIADHVEEVLAGHLSVAALLAKVAASGNAKTEVSGRINGSTTATASDADALQSELIGLEKAYGKQTKWLGKSAKWLRRGGVPASRLLIPVIGPVGPAVVGGVFLLGAAYVAYSVTDRIDARKLGFAGRVDGVIVLVERHF